LTNEVEPSTLRTLRDRVSDEDWWESSFDDALSKPGVVAFAVDGGGVVLSALGGAPRNVGLLVASEARGRGRGTTVTRGSSAA